MRAVEIDLFPRDDTRGDDVGQFDNVLENFLGALRGNGNICEQWVVLEMADKTQVRALAPADDAIERTNWSFYTHHWNTELDKLSTSPPQLRIVPETATDEMCCDCENPSSFILFSTYLSFELPVDCLDCGRPIPLYRLPYFDEEEDHWTLRQRQKSYQRLDGLYMDSWWGERMAYHLLSNRRAGFIKYSREIAAKLEAKVQKPVFVFLLNAYEPRGETCPRCNRPWEWPESPKGLYAFKCDHCRLISQEPVSDLDSMNQMHP
jgi:predicted  nucleic acid-binding Zn ribbon protein